MNKLKAIIVDDERLARKELSSMLKEFPEIEISGEAGNVDSALHLVEEINPDIIFLDIQMPGESGFDLINEINSEAKIIFVTAYDEFAIRAFEVNAADYLLKPVNPKRLAQSIEKIKANEVPSESEIKKLNYDDRMLLHINNNLRFIKINSIVIINAAGDYTEIHTNDGRKGITLKSIKEWESRLPENNFARIHRSTIINMDHVDKLEEWFNHAYHVYLKDTKEPIIMSRRYASKLRKKFG